MIRLYRIKSERKSQLLAAQTGQKLVLKTTDFQLCGDKLQPFEIGVQHAAELWHLAYIMCKDNWFMGLTHDQEMAAN